MRTSTRTAAKGLPLVAAAQTSRPGTLNWVQTPWEPREGLEQSAGGARAAKPQQQTCQTRSCFPKYISSTAFEKEMENREFRETQGLLTQERITNLVTPPASIPPKKQINLPPSALIAEFLLSGFSPPQPHISM